MKKYPEGAVVFLLLFIASVSFGQVKYPDPVGHVNDFANIIDSAAEQTLESKLRDYKDKTSIEIAVASVNSLEGITVDEYALKLFEKWGVGDRDKDNGILVLVAPNEREMRIEVGYGMEPDLTDGMAGRIIQNHMLPLFKEGKMSEGVIAGVETLLNVLGSTPYQTRLEERRIAEQKRLAEEKIQSENTKAFMFFAGVALALLFIIGTPAFLAYRSYQRKQKLLEQFKNNIDSIKSCEGLIKKASDNEPEARRNLLKLKEISPEAVWSSFEKSVYKIPLKINLANHELDRLIKLHHENGPAKSVETSAAISSLSAGITLLVGLSGDIKEKISAFQDAKNKSPKLLKITLSKIDEIEKNKLLGHKDVSDKARNFLVEAKNKCDEAGSLISEKGLLNWLAVYALIVAAAALAEKSVKTAGNDKDEAEEARRPKPVYRPEYRSPSGSFGSSGSSGGGSRGFGGFGGGRSGGGGARGKW